MLNEVLALNQELYFVYVLSSLINPLLVLGNVMNYAGAHCRHSPCVLFTIVVVDDFQTISS